MNGQKAIGFVGTLEVFILIMLSFSPLIPRIISIPVVLLLILFGIWHMIKQGKRMSVEPSFIILMLFFIISMAIDVKNTMDGEPYSLVNFLYPCYFVCGYLVAKKYDKDAFYVAVEKITFVFAILSLVGMSVYFIKPSLIYSFPTYTYNDATHRTIFFFNYLFSGSWMAVRNSGMAWEPGAFQILLNIAFQVSIQTHEKKKLFFRVCIYTLAIILTRSTIGYVILAINIVSLLKRHKKYIPLAFIVFVLGLALIIPELMYQIEYKLFGSHAFNARFEPMINAIKSSWYRPFGLGSTEYNKIYESARLGSYDCYTQILLRFGYPVLILVVARLFKIFRRDNKCIAIILIISFLSEPIWGSTLISAMYYLDSKGLEVRDGELARTE